MAVLSVDDARQFVQGGLQTRRGPDHPLGDGPQIRRALHKSAKDALEDPHVRGALSLGPLPQALGRALLADFVLSLDKETGAADHLFAHAHKGSFIMLEPVAQLAGGQGLGDQAFQKAVRMVAVGARQRRHDPVRRPGGQPARPHRRQGLVRKARQKLQPPADPADVPPAAAGQLMLRQPLALDQLAQGQGLFDGGEGTILAPRQHRH